VQQTRVNIVAALKESSHLGRADQISLAEDTLIVALMSAQPPDRVSVVRLLSFGNTLKKQAGEGEWIIDLTSPRIHKTSRSLASS